jgi:hypothetical protein
VISNYGWGEKSRYFKPTVAIGGDHHGNFDGLVAQSGDAPSPFSFDCGSPFKFQAKFGKKRDSFIERFYNDTNVVHP